MRCCPFKTPSGFEPIKSAVDIFYLKRRLSFVIVPICCCWCLSFTRLFYIIQSNKVSVKYLKIAIRVFILCKTRNLCKDFQDLSTKDYCPRLMFLLYIQIIVLSRKKSCELIQIRSFFDFLICQ